MLRRSSVSRAPGAAHRTFAACNPVAQRTVARVGANAHDEATQEHSLSNTRRQALLGLCFLALPQLQQQQPAYSRPNLLDLPACSNFKQAGQIAYCDIRQGSGETPLPGDLIEVDYTARAIATGKVYDGSKSFRFTVGNEEIIPGWELGIVGDKDVPAIKEGGLRTLLIPPELAYGKRGDGCLFGLDDSCRIPPDSPVEITFKYKGLGY